MHYWRTEKPRTKRVQRVLYILLGLMVMLSITQLLANRSATQRDSLMRASLSATVHTEITQARASTQLLSRTGVSNTYSTLSDVRMRLHSAQTLNQMAITLYGASGALIRDADVESALQAVIACEARLLAGTSIDAQLNALHAALDTLLAQVSNLP